MSVTVNNESEGRYDILQNEEGEVLVMIKARDGGPENPRFIYDGGDFALLYRSKESAIMLDNIHKQARECLKSVEELYFVEIENDEVVREYVAPSRIVKQIPFSKKLIAS
jgi:hypothetical protein